MIGYFLRIAYYLIPKSWWGDEVWTIDHSARSLIDILKHPAYDVHPPIQFWVYHFGHYRLVPLITGLVSLWAFSRITKDRLAVFLFAISPYFLHLSSETRGYGLLCMFSLLALAGYKWAFPFALFTEHYAIFLLLAIPFVAWYIPYLAASAWIIYLQTGTEQVGIGFRGWEWGVETVIKKLAGLWIQFMGGVEYSFLTLRQVKEMSLWGKLHIAGYLSSAVFLFYSRDKKLWRLFGITILFLLVFYAIRLNARYLPFCGVCGILLLTEGFRNMKHKAKYILMSVLVVSMLSSLVWMFTHHYDPYHKEDYRDAVEFLEYNVGPDDGVIGCRDKLRFYTDTSWDTDGKYIYEVIQGNPDEQVNYKHIAYQEKKLGRKCISIYKSTALTWVIMYGEK